MNADIKTKPKVVIIGGGFGGLNSAKSLKYVPVDIILIDKTNHHLFQPLLYQVATAGLSPGYIATPIRSILRKQNNTRVILGEVISIATTHKKVFLKEEVIDYDYLIVAVGSRHTYFGKEEWEKIAPGLKTLDDALTIRQKVLIAFEKAEQSKTINEQKRLLTFVVIGSGPTGVELAGALAEMAKKTMLHDFRRIDPSNTKIILIEATPRILPSYPEDLSEKARKSLEELGVEIHLNSIVTSIDEKGINIGEKRIECETKIWAAGNKVSSLLKSLNAPLDNIGRVKVENDLTIPNHKNVFVIGDAAAFLHQTGQPLPGVCPVAILQGRHAAKNIINQIKGKSNKPFHYFDKGNLATIGRSQAVADFGFIRFSGFFAWLLWVVVHIFFLIGFRNRFVVMLEWTWAYFTYQKSARLIIKS